jgi:radical SAM superfamily enzyme YgiQ (UPF0313 family)
MGTLYLASAVRDECDVSVIDVQGHRWTSPEVAEAVLARSPDLVGISINFTTMMSPGIELACLLRERALGLFIVAGGNSATFESDRLIASGCFDAVVLREGELTLRKLVEHLSRGRSMDGVPGIVWRRGHEIVTQPFASYIVPLDQLRFPDFSDLYQPERYLKAIVSSRGCTYGCIYCSTKQMWRKWRGRSVENIMAEVDNLVRRYRPPRVAFIDDEFTTDRERVRGICDSLRLRGVPFDWSFSARLEHTDEELLDWVAAAGCESIFFGIESGSNYVLKCLHRHYTVADVYRLVVACRARGILPVLSFMIGNPYETARDVEATLRLLREVDTHRLNMSVFTPFRGTPVHKHASKFGITLLDQNGVTGVMNDDTGDVFHCTQHLTADQIRDYWLESVGIIMRRAWEARGDSRLAQVSSRVSEI